MPHESDSRHRHDDYWKLEKYSSSLTKQELLAELGNFNYTVPETCNKEGLLDALHAAQLGHLSYHRSNEELRELIKSRGIEMGLSKRCIGTRGALIERLQWGDRGQIFPSFMKLPAELRNRVYQHHFEDMRQPIYAPSQPPISLTCRQLRDETLRMFYALCHLEVVLLWDPEQRQLYFPAQMLFFLSCTPPRLLQKITRVNLTVLRSEPWKRYLRGILSGGIVQLGMTIEPNGGVFLRSDTMNVDRAHKRIRKEVEKAVDQMKDGEGRWKFGQETIFTIRRVMEREWYGIA